MAQWEESPPASAGDTGLIPGLGRPHRQQSNQTLFALQTLLGDFPGGPVVKTAKFQCVCNPWSGNQDPTCHSVGLKKKKMMVREIGREWECENYSLVTANENPDNILLR